MIKDKNIEVVLTVRNVSHYNKFGVEFPIEIINGRKKIKYGEKIKITTDMLKNGSDQKINAYCDICLKNGIDKLISRKYNDFIRDRKRNNGIDMCFECGKKKGGVSKRMNIADVVNAFYSKNLEPLFEDKDYKSINSKLKFRCKVHNEFIQETSTNSLIAANYSPCKKCKYINISNKNKINPKKVYDTFVERNLVPLFTESEGDRCSKMPYSCKIHNEIQYLSYTQLLTKKYPCKICFNKKGKNSNNWKGGITPLVRNMRGAMDFWKKDKFKEHNYTCDITGLNGELVVHHINNFHLLFEKMIEDLNIDIREKIGDYETEELVLMTNKLLELHNSCKYSVVIKELHNLFHAEYGRKNNNENQYNEFVKRYKNYEFDGKLPFKYRFINYPGIITR